MSLLASSLAGANYMTSNNEDRESATNGAAEFTRRKKWPEILLKELVGGSIFCLKPIMTKKDNNQQGNNSWSWKIIYSSPAVIEMLGQKPADLEGKDFLDLVFSADHSQIQTFFHHLLTPSLPHHASSSTTITTSSFTGNNANSQNQQSSLLSDSQTTFIRMLASGTSNDNSPESTNDSNSSNSNHTPSRRGNGPIIWELRAHASGLGNDDTSNNIGTENLGLTSQNGTVSVVQQNNASSSDNNGIGMKGKAIWVMGRRVNEKIISESDSNPNSNNGGSGSGNGNGSGSGNNQSLDAFLELKLENERLREELRELQLDLDEELPSRKSSNPNISPTKPTGISSSPDSSNSSPTSSRSNSPSKQLYNLPGSSTNTVVKPKGKTGRPPKEGKELKEKEKIEKKRKKSLLNGGGNGNGKEGEGMHVCVTCGRTDSPEWRKGPLGPKTLCNACGLRWAKRNSNQLTRKDKKLNDGKK